MKTSRLLQNTYKEFRIVLEDYSKRYINDEPELKYYVSCQYCIQKTNFFGRKKLVWVEWCYYRILSQHRISIPDNIAYFRTVQKLEEFLSSYEKEPFNARIDHVVKDLIF